jgi:hypothetical protein
MATLHQQIVEKFLTTLAQSKEVDVARLAKLRELLKDSKKPKVDDLVAAFSLSTEGEIK